ncbi:MAG TPA: glycosyltransferase family 9 protein [Candidatus Eisenbacteria bacterium]
MPSGTAAVLRFSSLGDVLLAAHVPSFLKRVDPGRRVLLVTKERYGQPLAGHPHIDRLYLLEEKGRDPAAAAPLGVRGTLGDLVATMRLERVDALYDLHGTLRTGRVLASFPAARRAVAPKHAFRRRLWVHARWLKPAAVPPVLATYRRVAGLAEDAPLTPWLSEALSPEERRRAGERVGDAPFLLLGVGARWRTKRWPLRHFLGLAEAVERTLGLPSRFALAPGESGVRADLEAALSPQCRGSVDELPFRALAAVAARAAAIVSNDSAVLHLGPALGVPAVGLFGSTVPEFGFARQGPRDAAAGVPLACRPCGVHGRDRCPLGHHDCMERLEPGRVLSVLREMLGGAPGRAPVVGP